MVMQEEFTGMSGPSVNISIFQYKFVVIMHCIIDYRIHLCIILYHALIIACLCSCILKLYRLAFASMQKITN